MGVGPVFCLVGARECFLCLRWVKGRMYFCHLDLMAADCVAVMACYII